MKKVCGLLIVMVLILLTACSSTEQTNSNNNDSVEKEDRKTDGHRTKEQKSQEEKPIEVDKDLLNVEVTLPASLFQGEDLDRVIAEAKEAGVGEVSKNSDGSITYKMSRGHHKEMMMQMEKDLLSSIKEMKSNADLVSVKDITHNQNFSEFTLVVNKEVYENSFDGFVIFGLGISGMFYGILSGVEPEENIITILIKDETTQEVFEKIVYPEDVEEITD